mgnify:CR=1 FL=1
MAGATGVRWTPQALIFDCDGVLADTGDAWLIAERAVCAAYGVDPEHADRTDTRGVSMATSVRMLVPHLRSTADVRDAEVLLIETARQCVAESVIALPGVLTLIREAAGVLPVGVASNSPTRVLEPVLEAMGIAPLLAVALGADQVATPKPAPDLYLEAARRVGAPTHGTLVIEDSDTGITAARDAGCRVLQVLGTGADRHDSADGWLEDLDRPFADILAAVGGVLPD